MGIIDVFDGRGVFIFDYEEDGDLDVFIVNNVNCFVFYWNIGGNKVDFICVKVMEVSVERESYGVCVYLYLFWLEKEVFCEVWSLFGFLV